MTRLPRPDFLAAAPRPGLLAWAAAGTGALVLALGVADVMDMRTRIADQHVQLAAAEASAQSAPTRAVRDRSDARNRSDAPNARDARDASNARAATDRPDPRARNAAAPDMRAALTEARVLRLLGHPWQQLFTTLEEATPAGVQWLALDHGTDRADLRLAGAARNEAQAVALVDALAAWAGWSDVVLRKLALSDARGGPTANTPNNATTARVSALSGSAFRSTSTPCR